MHEQAKSDNDENAMPADCFCPITLEIMQDPVVAVDGHSYERKAIERWFAQGKMLSPKTGIKLETTTLLANHTLRGLIQCLQENNKKLSKTEKQSLPLSSKQAKINNQASRPTHSDFNFFKTDASILNVRVQNSLIEKILHADLDAVNSLLNQGALVTQADERGIYPLIAAVYSCDLYMIKYVELQLGQEAALYWHKLDLKGFENYLQAQIPEIRPTGLYRASYEWLANWYAINADKLWKNIYDAAVIKYWFSPSVTGWEEKDWKKRGETLCRSIRNPKEIWSGYEWSGYKIYRPPVNTHDQCVREIMDALLTCKVYVKDRVHKCQEDKLPKSSFNNIKF